MRLSMSPSPMLSKRDSRERPGEWQSLLLTHVEGYIRVKSLHECLRRADVRLCHSAGQSATWAGVELGLWNFLATSLQAIGLKYTSAVRGAFIIQVLYTP